MSHDRRARRVLGVLACVVILAVSSGCRRSPFHRLGNAPEIGADGHREGYQPPLSALDQAAAEPVREARKTSPPAVVSETSLAAAVPPTLEPDRTAEPIPTAPAPTPMLDEALKRAEAIEKAQQEAMRQLEALATPHPEPEPEPEPEPRPAPEPIRLEAPPDETAPPRDEAVKPASLEAEVQAPPADPAAEWRDGVDRLRKLARESAERPDSENDDQATLWTARAELVDCLPDDVSAGAAPAVLPRAVAVLADAAAGRDADASALSAEIESAVSTLEERVPLGINALELCRKIDGFGSFETVDPQTLKAGRPVLVYCELAGLRYGQEGDEFVSRVSTRVELLRADNGAKVWEIQGEAEDHCRRRRRDSYVSTLINIPESIEPGSYSLRLTQTDASAGASASAELAVTIQP